MLLLTVTILSLLHALLIDQIRPQINVYNDPYQTHITFLAFLLNSICSLCINANSTNWEIMYTHDPLQHSCSTCTESYHINGQS